MDECTGATIHNSSLNANDRAVTGLDGTLTLGGSGQTSTGDCTTNANTPWYNGRTGKFTSSINFDGTDDYINIGDNIDFSGNTPFTAGAWINPDTLPGSAARFLAKYDAGTAGEWFLDIDSTGKIDFLRECGTYGTSSTVTVSTGTWSHIVGVYDGSNLNIYLNGKLVNTKADSCSISNTAVDLTIGAGDNGANSENNFDGRIDSVVLYNYALTADMVKKLYNEGGAIRFGN
jgi:hypothetical protein